MTLNLLNSPFTEAQTKLINELYPTLTDYQKIWLNGYFSAVQTIDSSAQALEIMVGEQGQTITVLETKQETTILYGSQTGNAQQVAQQLKGALEAKGVHVTLEAMSDFKPNNLKKLNNLFIITSTHGEGEPPDNAIAFHKFIYGKRAPKLENLSFSVLSLGDSSYEFFCKTGIDFDEQLEKLGGKRLVSRVDCDLDYEEASAQWIREVSAALAQAVPDTQAGQLGKASSAQQVETAAVYSKSNPFYAEILESINLNGRGSNKHTQHIELSLEGSGLTYEPGDSLGIVPHNDPDLVTALLLSLGFDGAEAVAVKDSEATLLDALTKQLEITVLSKPLLQKLAGFSDRPELHALLEDDLKLKEFIYGRDLLDAVQAYGPFRWTAQQFVEQLRKIPPRLYSIASSQKAHDEEVHITVGKVFYEVDQRQRVGVASGQVTERLEIGGKIPVYIHKNPNFRLPEHPDTPVIMIGAGTGIAPYRAFLEERAEEGIAGKAWLFFGDQHFVTDFLYQTELQRWLKDGTLTNLSLAFSRDTEQKIYVQHRLYENAALLYNWLEQGAVIYVCGDEKHMAHDVDKTIQRIIAEQGGKTAEEAAAFVEQLKTEKRYLRDVY